MNTKATNVRTVRAIEIPVGAHLWCAPSGAEPWAGPRITAVDDGDIVRLTTINGGLAERRRHESVTICDHEHPLGDVVWDQS
jgi:hypothetical protein